MKVVLIKDVYKLGRAGEIKKVAAGYGRNYLIPQGLAIPASKGALQQAERIRIKATERRAALNEELSAISEVLGGKTLALPVKASETGRLYGSVSRDEIVKAVFANYQIELERRQVETEPIRQIGAYTIPIHLTMDLVPEITVIVHREGELPVLKTPVSEDEEEALDEAEIALEGEEAPVDLEEILPDEVEDEAEHPEA